jgi:hypothetical protein
MRDGSVVVSARWRSAGLLLVGILVGGSLFVGRVVELLFTSQADGAQVVLLLIFTAGGLVCGMALMYALFLAVRPQWLDQLNQWKRPSISLALRTGGATGIVSVVCGPFLWFSHVPADSVLRVTAVAVVAIAVWTALAYLVLWRILFRAWPEGAAVGAGGENRP